MPVIDILIVKAEISFVNCQKYNLIEDCEEGDKICVRILVSKDVLIDWMIIVESGNCNLSNNTVFVTGTNICKKKVIGVQQLIYRVILMMGEKQTYRYLKNGSILGDLQDEYRLSPEEYYKLYSFYVTYSMCGTQSSKKRSFTSYGWKSNNVTLPPLREAILSVLSLNNNPSFVFTDCNDLKNRFGNLCLIDGKLKSVDNERAVIGKTSSENNNYLKLFYRIRDGFAHGRYVLRFSSFGERMVVIQDNDRYNVTARIVIKLSTLLRFIEVIDVNSII